MDHLKEKELKKIVVKGESEEEYKKLIWSLANASLLPGTDSVRFVHSFSSSFEFRNGLLTV